LSVEALESRQLLASLPYGVLPDDTGEYMLGDIVVTVVLMESTPTMAPHDPSTENWTAADKADVMTKVQTGLDWWKSLLAQKSPTMAADLNFYVDDTYVKNPVLTGYEPINRVSNDFAITTGSGPTTGWMYDFLNQVGYNQTGDFRLDLRAYNHSRRLAGTAAHPGPADWAYTIFVVNSTADPDDDTFAPGGSFRRAFSWPGGLMMIVPSGRPDYTYAHEMAHQFWGLDEYSGSNYLARRGYYNTQNSNAVNPGYVQQPSIMTSGDLQSTAWETQQQAASALEMIGWRDGDGDGIFDVLDVPFELSGAGYYDSASGTYRFKGSSKVRTLPNLNSSGLGSDITINEITRAEYRINGGAWQVAATYAAPAVTLDLAFAVPPTATTVEIRTIDAVLPGGGGGTGASSPIFLANLSKPHATTEPGINGFVWNDLDVDGMFDMGEPGLPGWTLQLVNAGGQVLPLWSSYDPDSYAAGTILNSANPAVILSGVGDLTDGTVAALASPLTSIPGRVFGVNDLGTASWSTTWDESNRTLRMRFTSPVNRVSLDAIGNSSGDYARLEAYDATNNLLARYTTNVLASGQVESMVIERATPEIAYVIAKGHAGAEVLLDNLQYGAQATTVTGSLGQYALDYLPAGAYTVRAIPPASFVATGALPSNQSITIAAGAVQSHVDFAAQGINNPWQNPLNRYDVSNDTFESPIDALLIINDLNGNGARQLPSPGLGPQAAPPYLDVNGDSFAAPVDALLVINRLNAAGASEPPDALGGSSGSSGANSGGSQPGPDGEELMTVVGPAATAANGPEPGHGLRRFTARGRIEPAPLLPASTTVPTLAAAMSIDDDLALDVYRAWVKSRNAAVELEELAHDHSHDELDHAD